MNNHLFMSEKKRKTKKKRTKDKKRKRDDEKEEEQENKVTDLFSGNPELFLKGLEFIQLEGEYLIKFDTNLMKRLKQPEQNAEKEIAKISPFKDTPEFIDVLTNGKPLTMDFFKKTSEKISLESPASAQIREMAANISVDWLAIKRSVQQGDNRDYRIKISNEPKVTDQSQTGRCWMFAALNCLRYNLMKSLNVDSKFEFSESYLFFWDKIERSNIFLENMWSMRNKDINDQYYQFFIDDGEMICDGGVFTYFTNLVSKYGIIPKTMFDESYNCHESSVMNKYLIIYLLQKACDIRRKRPEKGDDVEEEEEDAEPEEEEVESEEEESDNEESVDESEEEESVEDEVIYEDGIEPGDFIIRDREEFAKLKEEWMEQIYSLMVKFMGAPPKPDEKFSWRYKDTSGTYQVVPNLTPLKFYERIVPHSHPSMISVITDHRYPENYYKPYHAEYGKNILEKTNSYFINLPPDVFKKVIAESLIHDDPVWFCADVGDCMDNFAGIMDTKRYDYKSVLGFDIHSNKADMLHTKMKCASHAMVFNGVDLDISEEEDKPHKYRKWRVENSWGAFDVEDHPDKGYWKMSDDWFDENVLMAAVDLKYFDQDIKQKILENKDDIVITKPWDVFGAVAKCNCCKEKK